MSSHRFTRTLRGAVAAALVVAAASLAPTPAGADPQPPQNTSDALKHLQDLSSQAEILTEQWKDAQQTLQNTQAELAKANADADAARKAADTARAQQAALRGKVDTLADVSFQGGRLNQLSAFLVSTSPQDFLDRASALDVLAKDNNAAVAGFTAAVAQATLAEQQTRDAQARASKATADAAKQESDVAGRQQDMNRQIELAKAQLAKLSDADRKKLHDPGPPPGQGDNGSNQPVPPVSGKAGAALQAAMSKIGSDYVWGAKGPNTFDCSGLTYWAYQQAGVSIPGTSGSQSTFGTPVPRSEIKAGDLVFYYSPVHHVGIAVDNNRVLHAPDTGQTVKISPLDSMPFNSARRVSG